MQDMNDQHHLVADEVVDVTAVAIETDEIDPEIVDVQEVMTDEEVDHEADQIGTRFRIVIATLSTNHFFRRSRSRSRDRRSRSDRRSDRDRSNSRGRDDKSASKSR